MPTARPATWIDALPGWLFTAAGTALLAVVVLTPAWLNQHEAAWRLGVMRAQADALAQQRDNYETFAAALQADDPVLLERLALTHLNLSLAGKHAVRLAEPASAGTADVGAWLAVPQPVVGRDLPDYAGPDNRLTRVATGPGRPALLAIGLACLIGGIFYGPGPGRQGYGLATRRDRQRHDANTAPRPLPAREPLTAGHADAA